MMTTILDVEPIEWIAVSDALPDSETTVLVFSPGTDEPVWLGYHDETWLDVSGFELLNQPTAWAPMPKGPERC